MSDDLRESLTAAFDEASTTSEAPSQEVVAEVEPNEGETVAEAAERMRDERGRFAKAEEQAAAEVEPWKAAPKSWRKEMHEKYGALPPEVMQYIHEREGQVTKGITDYKTQAETASQRLTEYERVTQPYAEHLQQYGGTERLGRLLHIDKVLTTGSPLEKQQMMSALLNATGIQLGEGQQLDTQNPLMGEVHTLRQQMQRLQQESEARELARATHEIQQFQQNAPYLDEVADDMQRLLQTGMATDLQSAYDRAIRLNDDVWSRVQQDKAKNEQARKAAQIARSSAVSPRSATPTAVAAPADAGNLRSNLSSAWDAVAGGRI